MEDEIIEKVKNHPARGDAYVIISKSKLLELLGVPGFYEVDSIRDCDYGNSIKINLKKEENK